MYIKIYTINLLDIPITVFNIQPQDISRNTLRVTADKRIIWAVLLHETRVICYLCISWTVSVSVRAAHVFVYLNVVNKCPACDLCSRIWTVSLNVWPVLCVPVSGECKQVSGRCRVFYIRTVQSSFRPVPCVLYPDSASKCPSGAVCSISGQCKQVSGRCRVFCIRTV